MLFTPFGQIKVFADGVPQDFDAATYNYERGPVKEHPIAGCYRIRIPVENHRSIHCEVSFEGVAIGNTGSSGQDYVCAEFISDTTILTIGAEDENPAFETVRTECGMEYRIHEATGEVVFGIAWAIDYEGSFDCRTWFAADPTLDK